MLDQDLRKRVAQGLLYTHSRLSINTVKILEAASFLYALIELLGEKGMISIGDLDARKRVVADRLAERFRRSGTGVMLQDPEYDKYTFAAEVSLVCETRLHLCRAACCRIPFALSRQDIREGIICWSLGEPYLIEHGGDGSCVHMDRENLGCTIYPHRPVPCRAFDCRTDARIWLDFENGVVNPETHRPDWPGCLARAEDSRSAADP